MEGGEKKAGRPQLDSSTEPASWIEIIDNGCACFLLFLVSASAIIAALVPESFHKTSHRYACAEHR